jgi:hypothetical protein
VKGAVLPVSGEVALAAYPNGTSLVGRASLG